jgi:peptidoglycan DL-endopeptidase CwlO
MRARRTAMAAGLAMVMVATIGGSALADPDYPSEEDVEEAREAEADAEAAVAEAEDRLETLQIELDELHVTAGLAVEAYNGARVALAEAEEAEAEAADEAADAEARMDEAREELGRLAASTYRTGGQMAALSLVFNAGDDADLVSMAEALKAATRSHGEVHDRWITIAEDAAQAAADAQRALDERQAAEVYAAEARDDAEAAMAAQSAAVDAAEAERETLIEALAEAKGTTADLERERQEGIEAAERAERERLEREREEQERAEREREEQEQEDAEEDSPAPAPEPEPEPEPEPDPPADSSAADKAVAFAYDQLGKPYEWGASGPGSYDCSGLTMRAWEQGGVKLTHWSVAQANETVRVSYSNIRKGDLIFWSNNGEASGTYHVAIYVGDGKMIHAPSTGKNIEVQDVFYWETPSFYGRVQT